MNAQTARGVANADRGCLRNDAQNLFPFILWAAVRAICNAVTFIQLEFSIECIDALNRGAEALVAIRLKGGMPKQLAFTSARDFASEADTAGEIAILSLTPKYALFDRRQLRPRHELGL